MSERSIDDYAVGLVERHPGEYGLTDLVKELRRKEIEEGREDMGLRKAREVVERLISERKIIGREKRLGLLNHVNFGERYYLPNQ